MKTFRIKFLLLGLVALMTLTTSCKKDKEDIAPESADSVVGVWDVVDGEADVYISGSLFEVALGTSGTLSFDENGRGQSNFSLTFMDETDEITGPFTWERDGFELLITSGDDQRRWVLVDDEAATKTVQFTEEIEDGEVEFILTLDRRN